MEININKIIRNEDSEEMYNEFDKGIRDFLSSLENSYLKESIEYLLINKKIHIGNMTQHNDIDFGNYKFNQKNELESITLDYEVFNIDKVSGKSNDFGKVCYGIYFLFIKALQTQFPFKNKKDVNSLLIRFLQLIYVKSFKMQSVLGKKKMLFDTLVFTFFYKFFLEFPGKPSVEIAIEDYERKIQDEFRNLLINKIDFYKKYNDLFKAFNDFGIMFDSPTNLVMELMNDIGIIGIKFISTDYETLLASAITSRYDFNIIKNLNIDDNLQKALENYVMPFYKKIKLQPILINHN